MRGRWCSTTSCARSSPAPGGRPAARCGDIPVGYYNDPVKTAETFVDVDGTRYVIPGDMAMVEADGSMTLLGRGSQSINSGGEKIFPRRWRRP